MRSIAISTDFAFAVMIFVFAIIAIYQFGNIQFHSPVREAQDIAVTFDTLGILWDDKETIKSELHGIDPNANLILKCYNYNNGWNLVREVDIYNSHADNIFWYRMIRYHNGEFCTIDVGVLT